MDKIYHRLLLILAIIAIHFDPPTSGDDEPDGSTAGGTRVVSDQPNPKN